MSANNGLLPGAASGLQLRCPRIYVWHPVEMQVLRSYEFLSLVGEISLFVAFLGSGSEPKMME